VQQIVLNIDRRPTSPVNNIIKLYRVRISIKSNNILNPVFNLNFYLMKNIILLIIGIFLFIACSENDDLQQENVVDQEEVINLKFIQNIETSIGEEQKILYSLLNKNEKAFVWNSKIDRLLQSDKLSNRQRSIIVEVQSLLTSQLFDEENANRNILLKDIERWFKNHVNDFSRDEIYNYFGTIDNGILTSTKLGSSKILSDSIVISGASCNCSSDILDCGFFGDCDNTISSGCSEELEGCGVFDLFPCRGGCS